LAGFSPRFLRAKISTFNRVSQQDFQKNLGSKSITLLCFKVLKNKKKQVLRDSSFKFLVIYLSKSFYQVFSFVLYFQNLYFLTSLNYSLQNLSSRILYYERCVWYLWTLSVIPLSSSWLLASLLCRGVFGFVPLLCAILLCKGLYSLLSYLVERVEILLGEGADAKLGARATKYIFMFVLAISLLYSLLYHALLLLLLYVYTCLILLLCIHLYWTKRAIEESQLL